jgi:hypothetical protein
MVEITAARELRYGGQTRHAGDKFEATDKDAKTLVAIGRATLGPQPNATDLPAPTYETAAVPAYEDASEAEESVSEDEPRPSERVRPVQRRRYQRRDLKAND